MGGAEGAQIGLAALRWWLPPPRAAELADTLVPGPAGQSMLARVRRPIQFQVENENYEGGPAWPRQAHLNAVSSKNYDIYTTHQAGPHVEIHDCHPVVMRPPSDVLDLTVVKASEHSLGHVLDPRTENPDTGAADWIRTAREHHLKLVSAFPPNRPRGWTNRVSRSSASPTPTS